VPNLHTDSEQWGADRTLVLHALQRGFGVWPLVESREVFTAEGSPPLLIRGRTAHTAARVCNNPSRNIRNPEGLTLTWVFGAGLVERDCGGGRQESRRTSSTTDSSVLVCALWFGEGLCAEVTQATEA
jgi:hypothetical protein